MVQDAGRMDDDQIEELRRWAVGLSEDTRPEVKAAAKAMIMLADDLRAARSQLVEERAIRQALEEQQEEEEEAIEPGDDDDVSQDLVGRLRGLPRRLGFR
jgi:hypothetical protein